MCDTEISHCFAGVVLDEAIDTLLDYIIPDHLLGKVFVGSRVIVPVKSSLRKATVWSLKKKASYPSLKEIHELATEDSVLTKDLILLAQWVSSYYCTPMHKVLKTMLPSSIRNHMKEQNESLVEMVEPLEKLKIIAQELEKKSPKQAHLLLALIDMGGSCPLSHLLKQTNASKSSILSLEKKNIIKNKKVENIYMCKDNEYDVFN